jgi:hypothetical protein
MDSYFLADFFILTNILQARMKKRRPREFEHSTLGDAIDKYIAMSRKEISKTKTQVRRSHCEHGLHRHQKHRHHRNIPMDVASWGIVTLTGSPQTSP